MKALPILLTTLLITIAHLFTACDKMDDNGPFEGNWLLMERAGYTEPEGEPDRTPINEGGHWPTNIDTNCKHVIVWCVRNQLIQARDLQTSEYYFFLFTRTDSNLQIDAAFHNDGSNDTKIELTEVPDKFCIPEDGHFSIVQLDSKAMVLKSTDVTLTFKKN